MKSRSSIGALALLLPSMLRCLGEVPEHAEFPTAPQQNVDWALPDGIADPDGRIKATMDTLFSLALADPRGCPYRHVTVREHGVELDARGWILPANVDDKQRLAIGWTGLIYPVVSVGRAADLDADLAILRKQDRFCDEPFDNYQEECLQDLIAGFVGAPRILHTGAAPYLMLRLGYPIGLSELGDDIFEGVAANPDGAAVFSSRWFGGPTDFESLGDLATLIRDDGVAAYLDKDDWLAAMRLKTFKRVWDEVAKRFELQKREAGEPDDPFGGGPSKPRLNPGWIDLLADAERRLSAAESPARSDIAAQISAWDQLESWDETNPPAEFTRVVEAGPAAIEPLLACLENDRRWTRIAQGDRHSRGDLYYFLRVRDLAIFALQRVLQFSFVEIPFDYEPVEEDWYAEAASTLRTACGNYENARAGDLWFRVLEDAEAKRSHHLAAAKLIVEPVGRSVQYFDYPGYFDFEEVENRFFEPFVSAEGETLRQRSDPSVLELMERAWKRECLHVDERIAEGEPETVLSSFPGAFPSALRDDSQEFIRYIERWQPGNIAILKSHYDWLASSISEQKRNDPFGGTFTLTFCEETLIRRLLAEDETAMQDYEKLFRLSMKNDDLLVEVMAAFPGTEGMDGLAKAAFVGGGAPFSLSKRRWELYDFRESLINSDSPLLVLPSIRQGLVEALQSQEIQCRLEITESGATLTYSEEDTANIYKSAALRAERAVGSRIELRLCDLIAYYLTPRSGARVWTTPAFHIDDPLADRDRAIARWIELLSERE